MLTTQVPPGIKLYDEKDSQWSRLHMIVEAAGDVTFNHSVDLTVEKKSFSIFVQTDKAIYKPGQTGNNTFISTRNILFQLFSWTQTFRSNLVKMIHCIKPAIF